MGKCDNFNFHRGSVLFAGVSVSTSEGAFFTYFSAGEFAGACLTGPLGQGWLTVYLEWMSEGMEYDTVS